MQKRPKRSVRALYESVIITTFLAGLVFFLTGDLSSSERASLNGETEDNTEELPQIVLLSPPEMIMIPGADAYFAPESSMDLFFHSGFWYRKFQNSWYRATYYNGPWSSLPLAALPAALSALPRNYQALYAKNPRISYIEMKKRWRPQVKTLSEGKEQH